MASTVPVYLTEISAPQIRGLIGGLSGLGQSSGIMVASWVGFACGYAPYGSLQWRLPLALQIPWGVILFVGLATFMPNSPRQLIQNGKVDEARAAFCRIRADLHSHEVQQEFGLMRAQIEYEQSRETLTFREIWKIYRHRVLVYVALNQCFLRVTDKILRCIAVQVLTALTGVNVIQVITSIFQVGLNAEILSIFSIIKVSSLGRPAIRILTVYSNPV